MGLMRPGRRVWREWAIKSKRSLAFLSANSCSDKNFHSDLGRAQLDWRRHPEASLESLRHAMTHDVVWVSLSKVRSKYALGITKEQNILVRYLTYGFVDLSRFYALHQPSTLSQLFFLPEGTLVDAPISAKTRIWPWAPRPLRDSRVGPGPVKKSLAVKTSRRINKTLRSVEKRGYFVTKTDNPSYFLLTDDVLSGDNDYRVVLKRGNHRIAILSYLGWKRVPLSPIDYLTCPEVCLSDIDRWPGVVDGTFSRDSAERLFLAFFRDEHKPLLPGW